MSMAHSRSVGAARGRKYLHMYIMSKRVRDPATSSRCVTNVVNTDKPRNDKPRVDALHHHGSKQQQHPTVTAGKVRGRPKLKTSVIDINEATIAASTLLGEGDFGSRIPER